MCEPATIMMGVGLAISAVSTGMSYMQQSANASAQNSAIQQNYAANYAYQQRLERQQNYQKAVNDASAAKAYTTQTAQVNTNLAQQQEQASQEIQEVQRRKLQSMGTAMASSENVGRNLDWLLADYERQDLGYRDTTMRQLEINADQARFDMEGMRAEAENRMNSMSKYVWQPINQVAPVSQPSLLGSVASFGADAFGTVSNYGSKAGWFDNISKPTFKRSSYTIKSPVGTI